MADSVRNGQEGDELFLNEVSDATPLRDRNRAPHLHPKSLRPAAPANAARALVIERNGELVEGRAPGVSRLQLADLRAGRLRPEAQIDLHGHDRERAHRALDEFLDQSAALERRCVLVIHGRGLHSDEGPVIKERVIDWLARSHKPIRGFCTARPRDGGTGAIYILLEKA